jgi:hypothetical protein
MRLSAHHADGAAQNQVYARPKERIVVMLTEIAILARTSSNRGRGRAARRRQKLLVLIKPTHYDA